jgi:hypothetical protein
MIIFVSPTVSFWIWSHSRKKGRKKSHNFGGPQTFVHIIFKHIKEDQINFLVNSEVSNLGLLKNCSALHFFY